MRKTCVTGLMLAMTFAAPAQAGLPDETDLNAKLFALVAADTIRKECGSIEPRMVRAYSYLKGLEREARGRGYSKGQIEAYVEDRGVKDAFKAQAMSWLAGMGGTNEAAICATGRAEIAAGSRIGRLLRAR